MPHRALSFRGYSSGATVAVEMAHQLGDVVRDIMLIDGWAHYPDSIKQKAVLEDSLKRQQQQWQKQIGEQDLLLEKLLKLQWQRAQLFEQYRIPRSLHLSFCLKHKKFYLSLKIWIRFLTTGIGTLNNPSPSIT